jgi:hypothetical protein
MQANNDPNSPKPQRVTGALKGWILFNIVLGVVFAIASISYVWLYMRQIQNGYRLAKLYQQQEELMAFERKLRLECCQFQDPFQLEEQGRNQFGLAPPRPDQKVIVR